MKKLKKSFELKKNIKNFGRKYKTGTKYKIYNDFNCRCAFCDKNLVLENENELYKEQSGFFCHIISAKNKNVRPSNVRHQNSFEKLWSNRFKTEYNPKNPVSYNEKNYFYPEGYSSEVLSDAKNLILLCHKCHQVFDKVKVDENSNINDLINLPDEESIKKILDKKKEIIRANKNNNYKTEFFISDKKSLENFFEIINGIKFKIKFPFDMLSFLPVIHIGNLLKFENKEIEKVWKVFSIGVLEIMDNVGCDIWIKPSATQHGNFIMLNFTKRDSFELISKRKNKEELKKKVTSELNNLEKINILLNDSNANSKLFNNRPDFHIVKNLLLKLLNNYAKSNHKNLSSASIAYMARWGTGKTTLIRTVYQDLKDDFNYVEINLWNISNSVSKGNFGEDNIFVRQIVKEAITQLINDPTLVDNFINSSSKNKTTTIEHELKDKMLASVLRLPKEAKEIEVLKERQKFLDQFITTLSEVVNTIFRFTQKPTIFVFDDLDRVNEPEIVIKILDAIVAFLNLKNTIYIIPIDESKVMKAISDTKPDHEPYLYMNKYFTYTIRSPFIPSMDTYIIFNEAFQKVSGYKKIDENLKKMLSKIISPTYRSIKDFINTLNFNEYMINNINNNGRTFRDQVNKIKDDTKTISFDFIMVFATILQINFPLLIDYFAKNIKNIRYFLKNVCNTKTIDKFQKYIDGTLGLKLDHNEIEVLESILITKIDNNENDFIKRFDINEKNTLRIKKRYKKTLTQITNMIDALNLEALDINQNAFVVSLWLATTVADVKNNEANKFFSLAEVKEKLEGSLEDLIKFIDEVEDDKK